MNQEIKKALMEVARYEKHPVNDFKLPMKKVFNILKKEYLCLDKQFKILNLIDMTKSTHELVRLFADKIEELNRSDISIQEAGILALASVIREMR